MSHEPIINNEIIFYTSPEGSKKIEVCYQDEKFWLTQKAMAELFGVQRPAITKHLKNIIDTDELLENSVSSKNFKGDRLVFPEKPMIKHPHQAGGVRR